MKPIRPLLLCLACFLSFALPGCGGNESIARAPITHGKWTVLVYLNAANDLDVFSTLNVGQMQQVATNPQVRFVVQWKQSTKVSVNATFNGTRRYLVRPGTSGAIVSQLVQNMGTGIDMGIPQTVNDFIAWGKQNYPADHYVVVVWDHGNGWLPSYKGVKASPSPLAVSYDDDTGHAIQTWQLNQAFQNQHVDIIAFDASLMQMDEVAYQLASSADFIAGSEESPPAAGYPYQRVLAEFTNNPDAPPVQLSKAFVDGMLEEPTYASQKITQSVVRTSLLPSIANAATSVRTALVANASAIAPVIPQARTNTQSYLLTNTRFYFDSIDLCNQIMNLSTVGAISQACANLKVATTNAIVWEGHNSNSPGSHGLAIDFSPSSYFNTVSSFYSQLAWNSTTQWSDYLSIAP